MAESVTGSYKAEAGADESEFEFIKQAFKEMLRQFQKTLVSVGVHDCQNTQANQEY